MRESTLEHLVAPGTRTALTLTALCHKGDHITEGVLSAPDGRWWWIAGGVPRLLSPSMYRNPELEARHRVALRGLGLDLPGSTRGRGRLARVQSKTIDRFGAEWLTFRDWGYHATPPNGDPMEFRGGLWENTLAAFRTKTFLDGRLDDKVVLDAGCGNGRFSAAAVANGAREVISVDIGWGVDATFDRHRSDPRIHVVQASLFDLPVRPVDAAFSLGVLMHTGDAARAFAQIAGVVKPGGLFAVRMYHRGNWAYEVTDRAIREFSTRLSKPMQTRFAHRMASLGRRLEALDRRRPGLRMKVYQVLHNWPTEHHNLDWWSAPVATHHTAPQIAAWAATAGLEVVKADPSADVRSYDFWNWPEALTMLLARPAATLAGSAPRDTAEHIAAAAA